MKTILLFFLAGLAVILYAYCFVIIVTWFAKEKKIDKKIEEILKKKVQ